MNRQHTPQADSARTSTLYCYVPGDPKGKGRPRFSRKSGRAYTPEQTVSAENWVRTCWLEQHGQTLLEGPLELGLVVGCSIPKSWPKKRKQAAQLGLELPTKTPDIDNIYKLAEDALNGIAWADDKQIVAIPQIWKVYSDSPGIILSVRPVYDPLGPDPTTKSAPAWWAEARVLLSSFG